jgi:hypothetical protein
MGDKFFALRTSCVSYEEVLFSGRLGKRRMCMLIVRENSVWDYSVSKVGNTSSFRLS